MFRKAQRRTNQAPDTDQVRRSTGIEGIDVLLAGGVKPGHILLLDIGEDVKYHIGIHRIFLAAGIEAGDEVVHISRDYPKIKIPRPDQRPSEMKPQEKESIAWRYRAMSSVRSTEELRESIGALPSSSHGASQSACNNMFGQSSKHYNMRDEHPRKEELKEVAAETPQEMLASLERILQAAGKKSVRISIALMLSPLWELEGEKAMRVMYGIKGLVRKYSALCLLSVPVFLLPPGSFSFAFADEVFKLGRKPGAPFRYDGILTCARAPVGNQGRYGVVCGSTGIRIEKIVIPPE